jgi:hypothetical protein
MVGQRTGVKAQKNMFVNRIGMCYPFLLVPLCPSVNRDVDRSTIRSLLSGDLP